MMFLVVIGIAIAALTLLGIKESREWVINGIKRIFNGVSSISKNIRDRYKVLITFEPHFMLDDKLPKAMVIDVRETEIKYRGIIPVLENSKTGGTYKINRLSETHPDKDSIERYEKVKALLK